MALVPLLGKINGPGRFLALSVSATGNFVLSNITISNDAPNNPVLITVEVFGPGADYTILWDNSVVTGFLDGSILSEGRDVYIHGFDWNGFNLRQVLNSSLLSFSGTASKVRTTIQSGTGGGCTMDHCYIGEQAGAGDAYDFDGTQVPVTFNTGSASVVLGTNAQITSDDITYAVDITKNLVIAFHFNAASQIETQGAIAGALSYNKSAANETSVSDVSAYSSGVSLAFVNKIEVFAH